MNCLMMERRNTQPGAPKTMKNKGFHLPKTWVLGTKKKVFDGFGALGRDPKNGDVARSTFFPTGDLGQEDNPKPNGGPGGWRIGWMFPF